MRATRAQFEGLGMSSATRRRSPQSRRAPQVPAWSPLARVQRGQMGAWGPFTKITPTRTSKPAGNAPRALSTKKPNAPRALSSNKPSPVKKLPAGVASKVQKPQAKGKAPAAASKLSVRLAPFPNRNMSIAEFREMAGLWDSVKSAVTSPIKAVGKAASKVGSAASTVARKTTTAVKAVGRTAAKTTSTVARTATKAVTTAAKAASSAATTAAKKTAGATAYIAKKTAGAVTTAARAGAGAAVTAAKKTAGAAKFLAKKTASAATTVASGVSTAAQAVASGVSTAAKAVGSNVVGFVKDIDITKKGWASRLAKKLAAGGILPVCYLPKFQGSKACRLTGEVGWAAGKIAIERTFQLPPGTIDAAEKALNQIGKDANGNPLPMPQSRVTELKEQAAAQLAQEQGIPPEALAPVVLLDAQPSWWEKLLSALGLR